MCIETEEKETELVFDLFVIITFRGELHSNAGSIQRMSSISNNKEINKLKIKTKVKKKKNWMKELLQMP